MNHLSLLSVLFGFILSGCGYLKDPPVQNIEHYDSSNIPPCKPQPRKLARLLEVDVGQDIHCLQKNLEIFRKYVHRETQEYIKESELESFIQKFFVDDDQTIRQNLKLLFKLNGLLLGHDGSRLSRTDIEIFFPSLRVFNKEIVVANRMLQQARKAQEKEKASLQRIKGHLAPIIREALASTRETHKFDMEALIKNIYLAYPASLGKFNDKVFHIITGLKKLFLGGKRGEITSREFLLLVEKAPEIITRVFQLYFVSGKKMESKKALYKHYQKNLYELSTIFHPHKGEDAILFHQDEVLYLVNSWAPPKYKSLYKQFVQATKSYLIDGWGVESDFYTLKNVQTIVEFGRALLEILAFRSTVNPLLKDMDKIGEEERNTRRIKFIEYSALLGKELQKIVEKWNPFGPQMRLGDYLAFLDTKAKELGWNKNWSLPLKTVKKMVLGGQGDYLSVVELQTLFRKTALLAEFFFDIYALKQKGRQDREIYKTSFHLTKIVKKLVHVNDYPNRQLFDSYELIHLGKILGGGSHLTLFIPAIERIKRGLLGGQGNMYTVQEFFKLVDIAKDFFAHLWFMHVTYELYQEEMTSPQKITSLPHRDHKDYALLPSSEVEKLRKKFLDFAQNYRFYRNDKGHSSYGPVIERNQKGLVEMTAIKWGFDQLSKVFGHRDEEKGIFVWNSGELLSMVKELQPLLVYYELWPSSLEKTIWHIFLLSDLFQFQSNGDLQLSSTEATEFTTISLQAIQMADQMIHHLHLQRQCGQESISGIEGHQIDCLRPLFFKVLLDDMGFNKYLVKLDQYVKETSEDNVFKFLKSIEGMVRDHPLHLPLTRKEIVSMLIVILTIESMHLRFDKDNDNVLRFRELDEGFKVYEKTVIDIIGLEGKRKKYAKTIYFYLIDKMVYPNQWTLIFRYYLGKFFKKVVATRPNVGVLLNYMMNRDEHNTINFTK